MILYLIENQVNGKRYIGQTVRSLQERWRRHCWACTINSKMPISSAIQKYGKENFTITALAKFTSIEELNEAELLVATEMKTFSPSGYNLRAGGNGGHLSTSTKEKIRISRIGKKASDFTRSKLSKSHTGKKQSEETKQKLSKHFNGIRPPEHVRLRAIEFNQKTYEIIDPYGIQITIVNMKNFCEAEGLSRHSMSMVVCGKIDSHRGWRAKEVKQNLGENV